MTYIPFFSDILHCHWLPVPNSGQIAACKWLKNRFCYPLQFSIFAHFAFCLCFSHHDVLCNILATIYQNLPLRLKMCVRLNCLNSYLSLYFIWIKQHKNSSIPSKISFLMAAKVMQHTGTSKSMVKIHLRDTNTINMQQTRPPATPDNLLSITRHILPYCVELCLNTVFVSQLSHP